MDRDTRILMHTKAYSPQIVKRRPDPKFGFEGDFAIGNTPDGVKLFLKTGHKWHTISVERETAETINQTIKLAPTDFITNDDASSIALGVIEDDASNFGIRAGDANCEFFAYVDVPYGYRAKKVKITGSDSANDVEVFTLNLDNGTISSEISNTGLDVNDDIDLDKFHVGTTSNMLLIKVVVTAVDDVIYGGYVDIEKFK